MTCIQLIFDLFMVIFELLWLMHEPDQLTAKFFTPQRLHKSVLGSIIC
jgi:hypothetical protein